MKNNILELQHYLCRDGQITYKKLNSEGFCYLIPPFKDINPQPPKIFNKLMKFSF